MAPTPPATEDTEVTEAAFLVPLWLEGWRLTLQAWAEAEAMGLG
jgi:hypothetical protein